jgi:hypothetical protein
LNQGESSIFWKWVPKRISYNICFFFINTLLWPKHTWVKLTLSSPSNYKQVLCQRTKTQVKTHNRTNPAQMVCNALLRRSWTWRRGDKAFIESQTTKQFSNTMTFRNRHCSEGAYNGFILLRLHNKCGVGLLLLVISPVKIANGKFWVFAFTFYTFQGWYWSFGTEEQFKATASGQKETVGLLIILTMSSEVGIALSFCPPHTLS